MDKEKLEKLIAEKIDEALKSGEHPKKFFITENGRGVTDGGDLYNAVLNDVIGVLKTALPAILAEVVSKGASSAVSAVAAKVTGKK